MNLREALDLYSKTVDINELAKDMAWPEDLQQVGQYLLLADPAEKASRWKEVENYYISILAAIEKYRDDDPFWSIVEPIVDMKLANALRKQRRYKEAMSFLSRILSMALDPARMAKLQELQRTINESSDELGMLGIILTTVVGEAPQGIFAAAYTVFVSCAMAVQDIPYEQVDEIVEDGIRYMNDLGEPDWAAGLHHTRARILSQYGRPEEALKEALIALASRRREPVYRGTQVWLVLNDICDYELDLKQYDEASASAQEVINDENAPLDSKQYAYGSLAFAYAEKGELDKAKEITDKYYAIALEPRNVFALAYAHSLYANIFLKQGEIMAATSSAACAWNVMRHEKSPLVAVMLRCAKVRIAQARELEPTASNSVASSIGGKVPTESSKIGRRRMKSALLWISRAQGIVDALFTPRGGGYPFIARIQELREETSTILSVLC